MPPKRRGRSDIRNTSTPNRDDEGPATPMPNGAESPSKQPPGQSDPLMDLWTDEQDILLYKGLIRWKPAGMHKHFRMVALSTYLSSHGFDPQNHPHMRSTGIWTKLATLYNLPIIDERENSFDNGEDDLLEERYLDFSLPTEDYGDEMWEKGRLPEGHVDHLFEDEAPPEPDLPTRRRKRGDTLSIGKTRASTVDDTDETGTSPAPSSVVKPRRGRPPKRGKNKIMESTRPVKESSDVEAVKDKGTPMDTDEPAIEDEEDDENDDDEDASSPRGPTGTMRGGRNAGRGRAQSNTRKSSRLK